MLALQIGTTEHDIVAGQLHLPRTGRWVANLETTGGEAPTGDVTLVLSGVSMPGHIRRSELIAGRIHLQIVGGNGGMGKLATATHYRGTTVRHVFSDLLRDAGESMASDCSAAALNAPLKAWTSLRSSYATIGTLVQALAETATGIIGQDVSWRIQYTGKVWIGVESWPACPADARIIAGDGSNASQVVGTDALGIWPGTTIDGRKVDYVVHNAGGGFRSTVYWAEGHL